MDRSSLMLLSSIGFLTSLFLISSTSVNGQSEFKEYISEPIGVKLQIPSQWEISYENNGTEYCFDEIINCWIGIKEQELGIHGFQISIGKESFNGSLKEFTSHMYNKSKTDYKDFTFLDDKQIMLRDIPAWQLEFNRGQIIDSDKFNKMFKGLGMDIDIEDTKKELNIYTKVNNTFYKLGYIPSKQSDYSNYLPKVINFFNTIEFIPPKPIEIKKPSFLDESDVPSISKNSTAKVMSNEEMEKKLWDIFKN